MKGVPRYLCECQGYLKETLRGVQSEFQNFKCFSRRFQKKFRGVRRMSHRSFVLQFRLSMALITATRAEGGLVILCELRFSNIAVNFLPRKEL